MLIVLACVGFALLAFVALAVMEVPMGPLHIKLAKRHAEKTKTSPLPKLTQSPPDWADTRTSDD